MLRLYFIGIAILIVAILANAIIGKIGLKSWYDMFKLLQDFGIETFKKLSVLDYLWLFVAYPLMLGSGYWIGDKVYHILFR